MSKADEMFEKLEYELKSETKDKGVLIRTEYGVKDKNYKIRFKEATKEVFLIGFEAITIEELQAINKKVKELRLDRRKR